MQSKRAFSIAAFCEHYGIGRTSAYVEIREGRLRVVKVGERTLVPEDAAESWLSNLPTPTQPSTEEKSPAAVEPRTGLTRS